MFGLENMDKWIISKENLKCSIMLIVFYLFYVSLTHIDK